ncbi:hypothetical protein [Streptomyces sp. NPDC054808]
MTAEDDMSPQGRARRELRGALEGGDALAALGASLRWTGAVLAEVRDDDSAVALEAFFRLYDALEHAPVLATEAPGLVAAARPGQRPAEQLEQRLADLDALRARVRDDRAVLERLAAAEDELRQRLSEHGELRERVEELRRLERLVDTLDALSEQQQVVDERLKVLRSRDTSAEQRLTADCDAFVRLGEEQLDALGPQTREAVRRADETGRRLAAEEQQLARTTSELNELRGRLAAVRAELGERVPQLERYARADRELAQALSEWNRADGEGAGGTHGDRLVKRGTALERAHREAADLERRLADVDRVLREALE